MKRVLCIAILVGTVSVMLMFRAERPQSHSEGGSRSQAAVPPSILRTPGHSVQAFSELKAFVDQLPEHQLALLGPASWAEKTSSELYAYLRRENPPNPEGSFRRMDLLGIELALFAYLASVDWAKAKELVVSTDATEERKKLQFAAIAKHLLREDPKSLSTFFNGVSGDLSSPIKTPPWFHDDPKGAISLLESLPPGHFRDALLPKAVGVWAETEPEAAIDWIRRQEQRSLRDQSYQLAIPAIVEHDLEAATLLFQREENVHLKSFIGMHIAAHLGRSDLHEAVEWANSHISDDQFRNEALKRAVVQSAPGQYLETAEAIVSDLEDTRFRNDVLSALTGRWAGDSFSEAKEWVAALEPGEIKAAALSGLAEDWMANDPVGASEFVAQEAAPKNLVETVARDVAARNRSGKESVVWIAGLPEANQPAAAEMIFTVFGLNAPAEAAQRIHLLPEDPFVRAIAVESLAKFYFGSAPHAAFEWATSLDPALRESARKGLRESPLDDDVLKKALLDHL